MKKTLSLLLVITILLATAGCGKNVSSEQVAAVSPAEDPYAGEAIFEPSPAPAAASEEAAQPEESDPDAVDVDLTQLSSTMVYSEVYAMVTDSEQYIGKRVKMKGLFATQEYSGERLYACVVQDATACCAQGLEFELSESRVFPDDYPEPGAEITVVGTFDTYMEDAGNGNSYIYLVLRNARLL